MKFQCIKQSIHITCLPENTDLQKLSLYLKFQLGTPVTVVDNIVIVRGVFKECMLEKMINDYFTHN